MKEFYIDTPQRPSGGRLYKRPNEVKVCEMCKAPIGRNYISCEQCYKAIESVWLMDWKRLIEDECIVSGSDNEKLLAEVLVEEIDKHPWTIVDSAMKIIRCKNCGCELGGGPIECPDCKFAFENLWAYDSEAMNQGKMTNNEHALRVGRWVLRYPHRQKKNIVESWKFSMPIVLAGKLPSNEKAGFFKKVIDENKFDLSSKVYQSFEEAYSDVVRNTKR
jgi:hypothetical protein